MKTFSLIKKLAVITLMLTFTSGCKSVMKLKYGMKEPQAETPERLISFLEKYKFPADDIYLFSDSASYYQALRNPVFRKNLLSHMNFDRNGLLLLRDTAQCQWSGYDVVKALHPDSSYNSLPGLHLDQILPHIQPVGRDLTRDSLIKKPDFTVIVTWGKFIGEYNYRLFVLSGAVRENKAARIRLIFLNIDMQESWNLTKQQKISVR